MEKPKYPHFIPITFVASGIWGLIYGLWFLHYNDGGKRLYRDNITIATVIGILGVFALQLPLVLAGKMSLRSWMLPLASLGASWSGSLIWHYGLKGLTFLEIWSGEEIMGVKRGEK